MSIQLQDEDPTTIKGRTCKTRGLVIGSKPNPGSATGSLTLHEYTTANVAKALKGLVSVNAGAGSALTNQEVHLKGHGEYVEVSSKGGRAGAGRRTGAASGVDSPRSFAVLFRQPARVTKTCAELTRGPAMERNYTKIWWQHCLAIIGFSVIPLLIVNIALFLLFNRIYTDKVSENLQNRVEGRRDTVDLFLNERVAQIYIVA